ncbi:PR15L protein, partial [Turnix velox]|nr:PR15L protein [Turnix velox]
MADSSGWWKLTFLKKRRSGPPVLYENPQNHVVATTTTTTTTTTGGTGGDNHEEAVEEGPHGFPAHLEKMVDKKTKGKHVKVSNSGRFKEKKKVRATLVDNPNLWPNSGEKEEK